MLQGSSGQPESTARGQAVMLLDEDKGTSSLFTLVFILD